MITKDPYRAKLVPRLCEGVESSLQCLREIHRDVTGGPDFAIFTALARMLALGYPVCGLLESDVKLAPGWFDRLMSLFESGEPSTADGANAWIVSAPGGAWNVDSNAEWSRGVMSTLIPSGCSCALMI